MEDITIESLISQRRVVTTADLLNPINDYMVVGVYQKGTNKSKGDGTSYKNYVISIAELLGGGSAYTASNGISLVGNDFRLTSNNISQFTNDSNYLTTAAAALLYQPIGAYITAADAWIPNGNTFGVESYIGTDDAFDFPIRTNSLEVARFTQTGHLGVNIVIPTARIHAVGVDANNWNYALKLENNILAELFKVANDGMVSSKNGYWQNGFKVIDIITATINTSVWSGAFPTVGGSRNTLIGGNDTGTAIVSGSYNSVFGDFTSVGDISGSRNLIWGNGNSSGITTGNFNILLGGTSTAGTLNAQIGFNAVCTAANEVVFGNKDLAIYDSFVFGLGQYSTTGYGTGRTLTFGPTTRQSAVDTDGPAIYSTWRFRGSQGTGTEHGGNIVFAVAPGGGSGNSANALVDKLIIKGNGNINMSSLPTSAAGLVSGDIWNNLGVLTIV